MLKTFIIVFFLCASGWSQTVKGIYTLNPIKGSGEETELSEIAKKPIYFSYIYSNKSSLQKSQSRDKIVVDTSYTESYGKTFQRIDTVVHATNLFYYKNYEEDVYRVDYSQNNQDFSVRDHIPKYQWNFEPETKTIAGYLCKKATTTAIKFGRKQNIIAWYCEDIPIDDGVMDFNGLPGLILQIEIDDKTKIIFEKIVIFPKENITIPEPSKTIKSLTIKEYENMTLGNH